LPKAERHWRVLGKKYIVSGHGKGKEGTEKESHGAPVPLRAREGDPPRNPEREGVQERVLASGV